VQLVNDVPERLNAEERELIDSAPGIGVQLSPEAASRLTRHLDLVYCENELSNLTRIPRADALRLHVLDSLAGLPAMRSAPEGAWIDLGSGAGFPGVVLEIASGNRVDLAESVGKKARFLESVRGELCLDGTVLGLRAEEAAAQHGAGYTAVAVRAVSELPALVELGSPFLSIGGLLVCWKGDPPSDELERGDAAAKRVGLTRIATREIHVPSLDARRCLVVYEKTGESRTTLPRRIGLAQSRPLA
jgi:16S rRNA (guanine527-N7)-methyltransferase